MNRNEKIAVGGLGVLGLLLLVIGSGTAPGASWSLPASTTESLVPDTAPPGRPVVGPDQHLNGYVYTPHRYPAACGNDISALIHHGLSPAMLPNEGDSLWISAPPSEGEL